VSGGFEYWNFCTSCDIERGSLKNRRENVIAINFLQGINQNTALLATLAAIAVGAGVLYRQESELRLCKQFVNT
jgi:hypothetical protein